MLTAAAQTMPSSKATTTMKEALTRSDGSVQEYLDKKKCCCEAITGVDFCVVIVAALIQKYTRLAITFLHYGGR